MTDKLGNISVKVWTDTMKSISGLVVKPIYFEKAEYFVVKMSYVHWQELWNAKKWKDNINHYNSTI